MKQQVKEEFVSYDWIDETLDEDEKRARLIQICRDEMGTVGTTNGTQVHNLRYLENTRAESLGWRGIAAQIVNKVTLLHNDVNRQNVQLQGGTNHMKKV